MHGYGFYKREDGKAYEGEYQKDKKHGYGMHTFSDGRIYQGNWYENKQHGLGIYITPKDGNK